MIYDLMLFKNFGEPGIIRILYPAVYCYTFPHALPPPVFVCFYIFYTPVISFFFWGVVHSTSLFPISVGSVLPSFNSVHSLFMGFTHRQPEDKWLP